MFQAQRILFFELFN